VCAFQTWHVITLTNCVQEICRIGKVANLVLKEKAVAIDTPVDLVDQIGSPNDFYLQLLFICLT